MAIKPNTQTPDLKINLVDGSSWSLQEQSPEHFTMVVFYRGLHCPICSNYLKDLDNRLDDFNQKGVSAIAVSTDTKERAKKTKKEWDIPRLPLGFGLTIDDAQSWGLYISTGISDKEPKQFAEPGLFLIRPDQTLYAASVQTMPFARPPFSEVLGALDFVIKNNYPARGEF